MEDKWIGEITNAYEIWLESSPVKGWRGHKAL